MTRSRAICGSSSRPAAATSIRASRTRSRTAFRGAFAKGVYFNTRIRDRFPYREVTHEDEETQS